MNPTSYKTSRFKDDVSKKTVIFFLFWDVDKAFGI